MRVIQVLFWRLLFCWPWLDFSPGHPLLPLSWREEREMIRMKVANTSSSSLIRTSNLETLKLREDLNAPVWLTGVSNSSHCATLIRFLQLICQPYTWARRFGTFYLVSLLFCRSFLGSFSMWHISCGSIISFQSIFTCKKNPANRIKFNTDKTCILLAARCVL